MPLDLTLYGLHRVNGQEYETLPGLMGFLPPRKPARGREHDSLLVALAVGGNAPLLDEEIHNLISESAITFYNSHGALTTALRLAADAVNRILLERNLASTGRGQYLVGSLILAALRGDSLTILQCGPAHAQIVNAGQVQHFHDATLSGKEIGLNQTFGQYFSQAALQPGDRILLLPMRALPREWEGALAFDRGLQPIEIAHRRMMSSFNGDVSAALVQVTEGRGALTIAQADIDSSAPMTPPPAPPITDEVLSRLPRRPDLTPAPAPVEEMPLEPEEEIYEEPEETVFPAHIVGHAPLDQPSAYAIPPQPAPQENEALVEQLAEAAMRDREFPPSIPRIKPMEPEPVEGPKKETVVREEKKVSAPRGPSEGTRQAARFAIRAIDAWRGLMDRFGAAFGRFAPRVLPDSGPNTSFSMTDAVRIAIAIAVPVIIATLGVVFYSRLGGTANYQFYFAQAEALRRQAENTDDLVLKREFLENAIQKVTQAESYDKNGDTIALRQDVQTKLDALLGVTRLTFAPALATKLNTDISRMAASESDIYLLDAVQGNILRVSAIGRYELDTTFQCAPGTYGNYTIGPMMDVIVLPKLNSLNSSILGVDAAGNLLYCAPGQVAQDLSLPPPPTNWGRVTALFLDIEYDRLYVLDAPRNGVWVYTGKDSVFADVPYFYFGAQIPQIQDAIDIAASGDELYLLHADGRLTHCTFSRVATSPTRCDSPVNLINPFPAYGDRNAFTQAHFTQLAFAAPPDLAMLILDTDGRSLYRISLRTYELRSIFSVEGETVNIPGPFTAMAVSPNHILYIAIDGQVYFTNEAP